MPTYSVSCRGELSGGAITHLREAGLYEATEPEGATAAPASPPRHYLVVEAGSPEDAILVARGALAVAGAEASDFDVAEA